MTNRLKWRKTDKAATLANLKHSLECSFPKEELCKYLYEPMPLPKVKNV